MGLFEQHPWMLIPLVIVITEGWIALKRWAVQAWVTRSNSSRSFR